MGKIKKCKKNGHPGYKKGKADCALQLTFQFRDPGLRQGRNLGNEAGRAGKPSSRPWSQPSHVARPAFRMSALIGETGLRKRVSRKSCSTEFSYTIPQVKSAGVGCLNTS